MFELTGSLKHVMPIMISIMVSKWVADALCSTSLYDRLTLLHGHPYLDHKKTLILNSTTQEIMDTSGDVFDVDEIYNFDQIQHKLDKLSKFLFKFKI